ncbi:hydroxymethylglutaryl-CoA lyase [Azorhizobium oxalatiphilum]|uniref:Hydroxymethylglutaryl-CoA lyase n=1 Tax=Azorhizobium oxalatiphilum TaxID=980631 RepID=A0A917BWB0_9HYPH|nr:hydroxymethylglutaryl-CoA lyase [Azorhizobium oxalatiphilum]GGF61350.1 hydroxymethylglutaryl-CoA lyase [Azorhizobium oxalatiphilum]
MDRLLITEVAPRDGLQNQKVQVSTPDKLDFIARLAAAGLTRIEAASFVSPKAVPQMADAEDVIAGCRALDGVAVSALTMNRRGFERALACRTPQVATVVAATELMNVRNIGMTRAEAIAAAEDVIAAARTAGMGVRAYVAVAFECPFEGKVAPAEVIRLAEHFADLGAHEVVIADTIGAAAPGQVTSLLADLLQSLPAERVGVHFHDTRGLGAANAYAAIAAGIRRLDSSAGGIGGCPFAPGAAGNLATEDLVLLAEGSGLVTGVDLALLSEAIAFAGRALKAELGGRSMAWLKRQQAAEAEGGRKAG